MVNLLRLVDSSIVIAQPFQIPRVRDRLRPVGKAWGHVLVSDTVSPSSRHHTLTDAFLLSSPPGEWGIAANS